MRLQIKEIDKTEDYKNRYGNLLDNIMKKRDDKMVNSAEEFMDSMAAKQTGRNR